MRDAKKRIKIFKQQVLIVGGGTAHVGMVKQSHQVYLPKSLDELRPHVSWKQGLQEKLGDKYDVFVARMPDTQQACYMTWQAYFNEIEQWLDKNVILIGHSLGGIFLADYLFQHPREIGALILIAAPYDDETTESLGDFSLIKNTPLKCKKIHLFHSVDDPVVPFAEMVKYRSHLPQAKMHIINDRQHFNQEEFPELVELIHELY